MGYSELHNSSHPQNKSFLSSRTSLRTATNLSCPYPGCAEYNISIFRSRKKGKKITANDNTNTSTSTSTNTHTNTQQFCSLTNTTFGIHTYIFMHREEKNPGREANAASPIVLPTMSLLSPSINIRLFIPNFLPFFPKHTTQHFIHLSLPTLGHDNLFPRLHQQNWNLHQPG